ncbi:MAG: ABC transporter permease [Niameybacter sp.]|uniref:ABC transporter permease n=1 Tax=Niameybacter sp. TaxID=2033640 RepID=UPI002FCC16C1
MSRYKKLFVSLISIFLGLLVGALFMMMTGHNPIKGFSFLIQGGLKNIERIGNTIATATPLILTGLSVAFAFRTGLFNIGAPGQMLFGGFCATAVGLSFPTLPSPILLPIMIITGMLGGAVWGIVPGLLKAKFNVHEVVSSIMMNWIANWVVYYAVKSRFTGTMETESRLLTPNATLQADWISNLFNGSYINLGIFIALLGVIVIAFILNKTTFGYQLKSVGFNRYAAEYAGISVNKNIIFSMMIAGGLSGLAGVVHYTGNASCIQLGVIPTQGFDGIAVALLGANTPIGALLAALFFGVLYSGRGFMSAATKIPPEIADTIIATIIYFAATSMLIEGWLDRLLKKRHDKANNVASEAESVATTLPNTSTTEPVPLILDKEMKKEDE